MVSGFYNLIWLCWIFVNLVPFAQCQFGPNGFGGGGAIGGGKSFGPPGGFGPGSGPFGNGGGFSGGGPPNGGPFGSNRFGLGGSFRPDKSDGGGEGAVQSEQPQAKQPPIEKGQQTAEDAASSSTAPLSSAPATPLDTPTAPAAQMMSDGEASPAPTAQLSSMIVTTSTPAPATQPLAGIPLIAPTSSAANNTASSSTSPAATFQQTLPTASARATVTTSRTVWVTPSSIPETSAAPVEENQTTASMSPNPSPTLDLAPLTTTPATTMSASEQAGMGIGITFGLLSIAGATGFYLWRRRRNKRVNRESRSGRGGPGGFFRLRLRTNTEPKNDLEWSIESASKVEIMRGGSAKSVQTGSRSSSPPSSFALAGPSGELPPPSSQAAAVSARQMGSDGGTEVLRVGMRVPDRKLNLALTSNPPISPSAFPTPPSSRGSGPEGNKGRSVKGGSWPLPE